MVVSTASKYCLKYTSYEHSNTYDTVAHSESSQAFEVERFVKIVNSIMQRS